MRHLGKWLVTMGLLAATPAVSHAALWGSPAQQEHAAKQKNQKVANDVAEALRASKLKGFDIGIEVKEGVASLTGEVVDAAQKSKATEVVSKLRGVKRVNNRLIVTPPKAVARQQPNAADGEIQQTSVSETARPLNKQMVQRIATNQPVETEPTPVLPGNQQMAERIATNRTVQPAPTPVLPTNQQMAERIAAALGKAGMSGYDLEVRFQDGQAILAGAVANPEQRARITQTVSEVPGVEQVKNQVTVGSNIARIAGRPAANGVAMRPPMQQVAFNQEAGPMPGAGGMPAMGMPVPMARGPSHQVYDMPNLPNYAWPSYAQYPNSAAITYPKEYSASAWPYIGPFYPYPQVPLGWRSASLEWDDGKWNLNFRSRTDKWWWFIHPKNW